MATMLAGDDLARTVSSRQSMTSYGRLSLQDVWKQPPDAFNNSFRDNDEEELRWAAIERLTTYDRLKKGVLTKLIENGEVKDSEIDARKLGHDEQERLMDKILKAVDDDYERFLQRLRSRIEHE